MANKKREKRDNILVKSLVKDQLLLSCAGLLEKPSNLRHTPIIYSPTTSDRKHAWKVVKGMEGAEA